MSSKFKPNTTQTPNTVFDRLMYELPDDEFKVICAIVRKTYGWHKDTDRISNSQFESLTGKAKRQIQRAKANLKRKGLISETPPDKKGGIPEYEFIDPVSPMTPPHVTHDTPPVSPMTPTKDTNQKTLIQKGAARGPRDAEAYAAFERFCKFWFVETGQDYSKEKPGLYFGARKKYGEDALHKAIAAYANDPFWRSKRGWNLANFFTNKVYMYLPKAAPEIIEPEWMTDDTSEAERVEKIAQAMLAGTLESKAWTRYSDAVKTHLLKIGVNAFEVSSLMQKFLSKSKG